MGTVGGGAHGHYETVGGETSKGQIGDEIPPRIGTISITGVDWDAVRTCTARVEGYFARQYGPSVCPVEIITELPASVVITGPPGTQLLVEAVVLSSYDERGAHQTVMKAGGSNTVAAVPIWARTFDYSGSASATFRDESAAIVGRIDNTTRSHTIPDGAASVELSGSDYSFLVFRQKG